MELNNIKSSKINWGDAANDLNQNFGKINNAIEQVKNATTRNKGYFSTDAVLKSAFKSASLGDIAYVGSEYPYQTWEWNGSEWTKKNDNGGDESVNLGDYYTKEDTDKKLSETSEEISELRTETDAKLSELGSEVEKLNFHQFDNSFVDAVVDSENKIIEATDKNGVKHIFAKVELHNGSNITDKLAKEVHDVQQQLLDATNKIDESFGHQFDKEYVDVVVDADNNIIEATDKNGVKHIFAKVEFHGGSNIDSLSNYSDIIHIIGYGQSLMSGTNSGKVVTPKNKYPNILSFSGGVRPFNKLGLNVDKITTITRNGSKHYGEMFIDAEDSLSQYDVAQLNECFSSFVQASEEISKYSLMTEPKGNSVYQYDVNGSIVNNHSDGETPLSGFAEFFNEKRINGQKDILISSDAYGSAPFMSMMPLDRKGQLQSQQASDATNMNTFEWLMASVVHGKNQADLLGKKYSVDAIVYFEESTYADNSSLAGNGTSDRLNAFCLLQLFTLINQRVRAITHQNNDVVFLLHQSGLSSQQNRIESLVGLSDFSLTDEELSSMLPFDTDIEPYDLKNIVLSLPMYPYQYASDYIHKTAYSQKIIGATVAQSYDNYLKTKNRYQSLMPISHKVYNNIIYIKYNVPYSPIVIDENALYGTNYSSEAIQRGDKFGFAIKNGDIYTDIINKVYVTEPDVIAIECSENPKGMTLEYAYSKVATSAMNGKSNQFGNVRDSSPNVIRIGEDEERLFNWSVCYAITI